MFSRFNTIHATCDRRTDGRNWRSIYALYMLSRVKTKVIRIIAHCSRAQHNKNQIPHSAVLAVFNISQTVTQICTIDLVQVGHYKPDANAALTSGRRERGEGELPQLPIPPQTNFISSVKNSSCAPRINDGPPWESFVALGDHRIELNRADLPFHHCKPCSCSLVDRCAGKITTGSFDNF